MNERSPGWLDLAVWSVTVVLVLVSGLLVMRHRTLKQEFALYRRAELRLAPGDYVPGLLTRAARGEMRAVAQDFSAGSRQVVIILTAKCPYCAQTLPTWKALHDSLQADSTNLIDMVAVTTDSIGTARAYSDSNNIPFSVVPLPDRRSVGLYRASLVPQTVIVDHEGRVMYARSGAITTQSALDSVLIAARQGSRD